MTIFMNYFYVGLLSILTFIGVVRSKKDSLKAYLVGYLGFSISFISNEITGYFPTKEIIIISYTILYINILFSNRNNVFLYFIPIALGSLVYLPGLFIPKYFFILTILVCILAMKQAKELKTLLSISMIGLLPSIGFLFMEVDFSIPFNLLTLLCAAYYSYLTINEEYETEKAELKDRLNSLEKDFKYEVRKEANAMTFYLREAQERINEKNKLDPLTKAFNKNAIFKTMDNLIDLKKPFALIMFDLDRFKEINDSFGHLHGDECLKQLVHISKMNLRSSDYIGRFGGDEFLVILPNANLKAAALVGEKIRKAINDGTDFTISIGICSYPADGKNRKDLMEIADKGLYFSKDKGRNKVSYDNPDLDIKF